MLIIWVILLWILPKTLNFTLTPMLIRKRFKQQKALQRPYVISWNNDTFTMESETAKSNTPWSDFLKWRENEHLFLVYSSSGLFRIIPKRVFSDEDQIAIFRSMLQEHIGVENKQRRNTNGEEHTEAAD